MTHTEYLQKALALAESRRGQCTPNPSVGAVIVKDGVILSSGCHFKAGHPHAEIEAFKQLNNQSAKDATLYVTLEPCCHYGKTPPCVDAIIQAGIKNVFYAVRDPNPAVAGKGHVQLMAARVACEQIPLAAIDVFYKSYLHWWQMRTPWITAKIALSLDGKIAGPHGQPVAITGEVTRQWVHEQRLQSDAILTTIQTVIADDPQLNVRLKNTIIPKKIFLLDRLLNLSSKAAILKSAESLVIFCGDTVAEAKQTVWRERGVRIIPVPTIENHLDLTSVNKLLGIEGLFDVWLEVGGRALAAFLNQHLVHTLHFAIGPKLLGVHALQAALPELDLLMQGQQFQQQTLGTDMLYSVNLQ